MKAKEIRENAIWNIEECIDDLAVLKYEYIQGRAETIFDIISFASSIGVITSKERDYYWLMEREVIKARTEMWLNR